jgi:hypothetical protein
VKRRFPKLALWLASIYLVWSLLVFFGSLGSESHSWWPIFLYPLLWPLSLLFHSVDMGGDAIYAVFYIIVGTIWMYGIGRLFSILATRLFPIRDRGEKSVG